MKRTSLSLPDDLAQALSREARRRSTSVSDVAREALAKQMGLSLGEPRELPFAAVGNSGASNTARDMEELLRQEWDGETGRR
jgi:metal-responsive CopG/Arc/MetJ family transcriptional regulator